MSSSFGVTEPAFLKVDRGAPVAELLTTPLRDLGVYVQMNRRVIATCLFHHVVSPSSVIFRGKGDHGFHGTFTSRCITFYFSLDVSSLTL